MDKSPESFTFTVGKLDAGMAILLGERAHLIEFPSILLPAGVTAGSIVNIAVHQNFAAEKKREQDFWELQDDILQKYGKETPQPPELKVRNVTQTSVTLEWPPLQLATARLRSLEIYRNNQRLAAIPSPLTSTSTKLSGLDINTSYHFQLVLHTTAGSFSSNVADVQTHTMSNTSGISVCFGNVQDPQLLEAAKIALDEMGAKWSDKIQIDTTHFVCTTPAATPSGAHASGSAATAPGVEYQRALQLSIPVVQPHWILACRSERKMVPIASYYLGTTPNTPFNPAPFTRPQSMSQTQTPGTSTPPPNSAPSKRASMPAPSRGNTGTPPQLTARPQPNDQVKPSQSPESLARTTRFEPTPEEQDEEETEEQRKSGRPVSIHADGKMNKHFKFPPSPPLHNDEETSGSTQSPPGQNNSRENAEDKLESVSVVAPSSVEVPAPELEHRQSNSSAPDVDEDLDATEEIDLN